MKQKIALLFMTLLLFGFSQAQVSKESYEKAVDLLNCKTVELTLSKENIQQYLQQCPCNETGFSQIKQFLNSVGKLDATIALSAEVESLKKSFDENLKKEDVVSFLSESIFFDKKYQRIVAFAEKRKGSTEFQNYKESLKADLSRTLIESVLQETVDSTNTNFQQSTIEERVAALEYELNAKTDDTGILGGLADYLIVLSIIIGIIASVLSLRKQNGNDREASNEIRNYVRKKIEEAAWDRSTQSNNVDSAELRDANKRIRDLESEIEKIKSFLNNSNPVSIVRAQPAYQETRQPEIKTETFFLSTPNGEGSFNESSASLTYREGATIYRLTKIGSNRVKFQIDEKDASVKLALQFPDKNIDPVCDAINAFNPKATRITTVEQGEAELQNGKWVVDRNKKAKIRYEN